MRRSQCYALVLAVCLCGGLQGVGFAQDATPGAEFVTPDPSECQIEPRTLDSVIALLGAQAATPATTPAADDGEPADDETVAAVTAVARESVACFNAGDFLRQFAFYTDDAILAIMPPGLSVEELTGFLGAPPEPLPVEARESVLVQDVRIQPGGLVTAYFVMRNPEGTFTTFVTLRAEDGGFVIVSDVDAEGGQATPAA